jgi:hypothetical protein
MQAMSYVFFLQKPQEVRNSFATLGYREEKTLMNPETQRFNNELHRNGTTDT